METVRHEALLYEKLPDSRVQCHTCQWGCKIAPDKFDTIGGLLALVGVGIIMYWPRGQ